MSSKRRLTYRVRSLLSLVHIPSTQTAACRSRMGSLRVVCGGQWDARRLDFWVQPILAFINDIPGLLASYCRLYTEDLKAFRNTIGMMNGECSKMT